MKKLLLTVSIFALATASAFALPKLLQRELFKVNQIDTLAFNLTWENLRIEECDEAENILIEIYCNKAKYAPLIKSSGSSIKVQSREASSWFGNKKCTVIARIPSGAQFQTFSMATSSGNIHSQMQINAENFASKTTSGNQSITAEIFTQSTIISSTSGSIYVETVFGNKLDVSASSGSINVNAFDGKDCSIKASSGSVKLTNAKLDKVKMETSSGSITLEGKVYEAFDLSATSGRIGLELDDAPINKSRAKTSSGSIFLGLPGNADFSLWVQTSSGSFTNALTREKLTDHVNYTQDMNNGGATIILSATSGNIYIDSNNGASAKISAPSIDPDIPVVSFDDPIF